MMDGAAAADSASAASTERLGLWDAVSIIVGIVIGAGIYETAPLVFSNVSSPLAALSVWVLGGAVSLMGAACYAELASTYPRSGGDYVYLSRGFSPFVGFLFGWAQLAVILTGSIGMMAYVFSDYGVALTGIDPGYGALLAAAPVLVLTALNLASVALGKSAQNFLSWSKLLGIAAVIVVGMTVALTRTEALPATLGQKVEREGSFGLAMILVLYTFGGWNDAAFVAAEVRDRRRNLPRALVIGTAAITLVYVLMNASFLAALGFEGAQKSQAIARDVFQNVFGNAGGVAISVLVMVSALSAVNALIFTGARVYASLGADYSALSRLGRWHPRLRSPAWSLVVQLAITLVMIGIVGTRTGRSGIDGVLVQLGFAPATWSGHGGFDTLLRCTAPVFWSFFLLTGISLFLLRRKDPQLERPFRVPLYPITPLIFCATCAYMLYSAVDYAGKLTALGLIPLLVGVPVYFSSKRRPVAGQIALAPQEGLGSSPGTTSRVAPDGGRAVVDEVALRARPKRSPL